MEECVLDIQLMDGPRTRDGDAQHDPDGLRFDHRTESLIVVDAMLLGVAADNLVCFVAGKRAISMEPMFKTQFARNHISTGGARNKNPGALSMRALYSSAIVVRQLGSVRALR